MYRVFSFSLRASHLGKFPQTPPPPTQSIRKVFDKRAQQTQGRWGCIYQGFRRLPDAHSGQRRPTTPNRGGAVSTSRLRPNRGIPLRKQARQRPPPPIPTHPRNHPTNPTQPTKARPAALLASRGLIHLASEIAFATTSTRQRGKTLRTPEGTSQEMREQPCSWRRACTATAAARGVGRFRLKHCFPVFLQ